MYRLLRYLKTTAALGLVFRGSSEPSAKHVELGPCFADSDWAGDVDSRKSTSGMAIKINGTVVQYRSKMQSIVAHSSAEAEYVSLSDASKAILAKRSLMSDMGLAQKKPTLLYGDNEASLVLSNSESTSRRTRHIDVRFHFIRECVKPRDESSPQTGSINLQWIPTADQEADIFTNALGKIPFQLLRDRLMGI